MYIFALKEITEIKGKLKFFKLLVNGTCEYDQFEKEIINEGNLTRELTTIITRMHEIADLKSLPKSKFRDITPKKDTIKEYEIKTKHLRVYLFHEKNTGRVIVCGGKKGTQQKDIKHFRNIKKEYLKQKQ
jgi:putative component of toxin-antitoxin plasmid stabilization module